MKNLNIRRFRLWLVWIVFLAYSGLQTACTPENMFDQNIEINLQILLPNPDGLKSSASIAGVKRVTLTVTSGTKVLDETELTITGKTATGTVKIERGENIKFTAEAIDENDIVQWQGSTTINIVDNFTVGIELTSIPPSTANLQGSQEGKSVNLSWIQNNDPDFARYDLYRSQSDTLLGTNLKSITDFSENVFIDTTISEGRNYFYTLVVTDTEGFITKSNVVSINVPFIPPIQSVLKVDSISNIVILSWTQNTDQDFAKYVLLRSNTENIVEDTIHSSTVLSDTVFTDDSITEGSTYSYKLVVYDTDGLNAESNVVEVYVEIISPTKSKLYAEYYDYGEGERFVSLSWDQNSDLDFARYELYRSKSENILDTLIYSTADNNYTYHYDDSISEGSTYYYTLVVYNIKGWGTKSDVVPIEIPIVYPTKSNLYAYWGEGDQIYLNWDQNNDSDFARYELYRSDSENSWGDLIYSPNRNIDTYFYDPISPGKIIYYRLIVYDTKGFYTESDVKIIDFGPLRASTLSGTLTNCSVNFSWSQNSSVYFANYRLYRSESENELGTEIFYTDNISETKTTDNDPNLCYFLSEGVTYYYTLIVNDYTGNSAISNIIKISAD